MTFDKKKWAKERKRKISESRKGQRHSLEARRNMSEARKGITHKTKGSFKKGYTPWNKKKKENKRKFIRIDGNVVLNSRYVWANYHNQNIPIGFVIHHIDENQENDDIKNLRLMRKQDHNFLHQMLDKKTYEEKKKVEKLKEELCLCDLVKKSNPLINPIECVYCRLINKIFGSFGK